MAEGAGIDVDSLFHMVDSMTEKVQTKIGEMGKASDRGEEISISEMFSMQMKMNRLSQVSEATTSVTAALHAAIMAMARNVKG